VTTSTIRIGDAVLTRVSYAEVDVEPEQVGLSAAEVVAAHAPTEWAAGEKPRASASAWIIEHDGARIVVDPAGAVDVILRNDNDAAAHQQAFAEMLDGADIPASGSRTRSPRISMASACSPGATTTVAGGRSSRARRS
jgi:hypothetical protein